MQDTQELLGAIKRRLRRKLAKKPASRLQRLARLRLLAAARKKKAKAARPLAKKPAVRRLLARLPAAKKKDLIKKAILRNPTLKKKLAAAVLKKRLRQRQQGAFMAPSAIQTTSVPSTSPSAPPASPPGRAAIETEETPSAAQVVEDEGMEAPLEEAGEVEAEKEEQGEEAAEAVEEDMAEDASEELTEPDAEEAAEESEEIAEDAAEAAETAGDDIVLGYVLGRHKQCLRRRSKERMAVLRALPLARQVETASLGAIPAKRTLKGVRAIARAKGGDKKTKKAIKSIAAKAKKGDKKSKKAMAQLKVASKVMKKTAKKKAPKKAPKLAKKTARKVPYTKPVRVIPTGLYSYSAHQRGLAMIPGFARRHYGEG